MSLTTPVLMTGFLRQPAGNTSSILDKVVRRRSTGKLTVASLQMDVLWGKLHALAVFVNVGLSDCQILLLKLKGLSLPAATLE